MTTENSLKIKIKPEHKKIELPSQNEVENWSIPDEPLSWESLQKLHDPEEVKKLIKERHGLNFEDLFEKTPNTNTSRVKFDEYYLIKLAIFRLECINWLKISEFLDEEFNDYGNTHIQHNIKTISSKYFSDKLKARIKSNFDSIGFCAKRIAELFGCRDVVDKICQETLLPIDKVFQKTLQYKRKGKFDFCDICNLFLRSIQRQAKPDLSAGDANLIDVLVSHFFFKRSQSIFTKQYFKSQK